MAARKIIFDSDCEAAVKVLGGYERLDPTLEAFWDGLRREPRGFPMVETDWGNVRYIRTKAISGAIPELIWFFSINSHEDVIIFHVEECTRY